MVWMLGLIQVPKANSVRRSPKDPTQTPKWSWSRGVPINRVRLWYKSQRGVSGILQDGKRFELRTSTVFRFWSSVRNHTKSSTRKESPKEKSSRSRQYNKAALIIQQIRVGWACCGTARCEGDRRLYDSRSHTLDISVGLIKQLNKCMIFNRSSYNFFSPPTHPAVPLFSSGVRGK